MAKKIQPTPERPAQTNFPFLVKVTTTAIIRNPAGIEEKRFLTSTFQLDEKAATMPWYALRNFVVPAYLNRTLGPQGSGWVKIYEIKILKMVNRHNPDDIEGIPVRIMTTEQLQKYCERWELPVDPKEFHSVEYARQMVQLCETDPTGYKKQYAAYVEGLNRKYPELDGVRKNLEASIGEELDAEFDKLDKSKAETPSVSLNEGGELTQEEVFAQSVVGEEPAKKAKSKKKPASEQQAIPEKATPVTANDPFAGV